MFSMFLPCLDSGLFSHILLLKFEILIPFFIFLIYLICYNHTQSHSNVRAGSIPAPGAINKSRRGQASSVPSVIITDAYA